MPMILPTLLWLKEQDPLQQGMYLLRDISHIHAVSPLAPEITRTEETASHIPSVLSF